MRNLKRSRAHARSYTSVSTHRGARTTHKQATGNTENETAILGGESYNPLRPRASKDRHASEGVTDQQPGV